MSKDVELEQILIDHYGPGRHVAEVAPIIQAHTAKAVAEARRDGINAMSEAITRQLPPISAWDGQEQRDNSMVHELVKNAIARLTPHNSQEEKTS